MWPHKNSRTLPAISDRWSVVQFDSNGSPGFARVRQDLTKEIRDYFEYRIGVAIPLNAPDEHGFPQGDEFDQLSNIEDKLASQIEHAGNGVQVIAITSNGMREFVFYVRNRRVANKAVNQVKGSIAGHELQSYVKHDPDWVVYQQFETR